MRQFSLTHMGRKLAQGLTWLTGDLYRLVLLAAILLYTWVFARLAVAQHLGMRTHKADLGQINQAIWNSSQGRFLEMTDFGFIATRMTDHVEPVLVFISPLYWFWNDMRAILILQVLFVAWGAWILYHLTLNLFEETLPPAERDKIWHADALLSAARPIALSLAVAYLLAPPLQAAVLTEFHAVPLVVPMILWALWAVAMQRWAQFVVAVLLTATVKEETALLAAGLGFWAIWRMSVAAWLDRNAPRLKTKAPLVLAVCLTMISLVWFYVATFVIVPAHAEPVYGIAESGYFARYGALGDSPADILRSFFTQPGLVWAIATEPVRLDYLRRLLMPFGFLPLLAPEVVLLSLPVLLANQLSAYPAQYYGEYHYSAPVIVYFAAAAAFGAARLWRWSARLLSRTSASFQHMPAASGGLMNLAALLTNARTALRPVLGIGLIIWFLAWGGTSYLDAGRGPGGPRLDATPVTEHHLLMPRFTAQIPPDAAVTATAAVHPHVSHRRFVYQFPTGMGPPTPPAHQADFALLNVTMAIDMAPGDLRAQVEEMLAGEWGVVDAADGFLLLHKGAPEKSIPSAFYTFTRLPNAPGGTAAMGTGGADSTQPITLLQTEILDRPYWRATQIISHWQVGSGFDAQVMPPRLAIYAPTGEVVDADINMTAPALAWVPPASWQPGDTLRVTTLPHYLPAAWGVAAHRDVMAGDMAQPGAGEQLVAAYWRGRHDILHELPTGPHGGSAEAVAAKLGLVAGAEARFQNSEAWESEIRLRPWYAGQASPGGLLNVFLEWEIAGEVWPPELNVFVHLRAAGENQAQADGRPRYFVEGATAHAGRIWDWRQLMLPADATAAKEARWAVVVGLYDPASGARVPLVNEAGLPVGDEFQLGELHLTAPPPPDQTCALIPSTCASQP